MVIWFLVIRFWKSHRKVDHQGAGVHVWNDARLEWQTTEKPAPTKCQVPKLTATMGQFAFSRGIPKDSRFGLEWCVQQIFYQDAQVHPNIHQDVRILGKLDKLSQLYCNQDVQGSTNTFLTAIATKWYMYRTNTSKNAPSKHRQILAILEVFQCLLLELGISRLFCKKLSIVSSGVCTLPLLPFILPLSSSFLFVTLFILHLSISFSYFLSLCFSILFFLFKKLVGDVKMGFEHPKTPILNFLVILQWTSIGRDTPASELPCSSPPRRRSL